jgi:hypothetical protein
MARMPAGGPKFAAAAGMWLISDEHKGTERVTFSRGYDVCIMAIDGTWRRDCVLNAISDRCELVRVNGTDMDVSFIKGNNGKKRHGNASGEDAMMA